MNKQQVIEEAKNQVYQSIGFYFSSLNDKFTNALSSAAMASKSANQLLAVLVSGPSVAALKREEYLKEEARMEQAPGPSATEASKSLSKSVGSFALTAAAFAALLPLLIDDKIKKYIVTWWKTFLENVGVTNEVLDKVSKVYDILKTSLIVYLGYKTIKKVADVVIGTIKLMRAMAVALGLMELFEQKRVADAIDLEKRARDIRREKARVRLEKRKLKGKGAIQRGLAFIQRVGPKLLGNLIKAVPLVGTFVVLGMAIKEVAEEALDFFSGDEDKPLSQEEEELILEIEKEEKAAIPMSQEPRARAGASLGGERRPGVQPGAGAPVPMSRSSGVSPGAPTSQKENDLKKKENLSPGTLKIMEWAGEAMEWGGNKFDSPGLSEQGKKLKEDSQKVISMRKEQAPTNTFLIDNSTNMFLAAPMP